MSTQSSFLGSKAVRVAAQPPPQQQQQQQQALKQVQPQPAAECAKTQRSETAPRGATPVQQAAATAPPAAEAVRGATPVNASRRTLVLKSYPELKKECEEMTAVRRRRA
jgi:hypothetical protein